MKAHCRLGVVFSSHQQAITVPEILSHLCALQTSFPLCNDSVNIFIKMTPRVPGGGGGGGGGKQGEEVEEEVEEDKE